MRTAPDMAAARPIKHCKKARERGKNSYTKVPFCDDWQLMLTNLRTAAHRGADFHQCRGARSETVVTLKVMKDDQGTQSALSVGLAARRHSVIQWACSAPLGAGQACTAAHSSALRVAILLGRMCERSLRKVSRWLRISR